MNNNLLPDNEVIEYEGQLYTNPQNWLDESNAFIERLYGTQNANNAEINAQTRNLGTSVPSNLGGLVGGEGYWTSRYQTPQTNAVAANLMAANRYTALAEAMQNNLAAQKQRLSNSQKAARRRAASYGGGGGDIPAPTNIPENINQNTTTVEVGDVDTEGLAKSRYQQLFIKYKLEGLSNEEAEKKAKEDHFLKVSD